MKFSLAIWTLLLGNPCFATPKVLIVVAHPDDEYFFAASVYHLAKEKNALVDQMIVTNGEGGFKYSAPAEKIYNKKLSTETIGRRELPAIRKKESESSGKILGIHQHLYLDQKDTGFNRDLEGSLKTWDTKKVVTRIADQIKHEHYDFVLTLMPTSRTHGGHQAATLLTLRAIKELPVEARPAILAAFTTTDKPMSTDSDQYKDQAAALSFTELPHYEETKIAKEAAILKFDRNKTLEGSPEKLTYQLIVNWLIAEHKSQGLFQTLVGQDDWEQFKIFELGGASAKEKAKTLF